MQDIHTVTKKH